MAGAPDPLGILLELHGAGEMSAHSRERAVLSGIGLDQEPSL
jgi:hypothetical protein